MSSYHNRSRGGRQQQPQYNEFQPRSGRGRGRGGARGGFGGGGPGGGNKPALCTNFTMTGTCKFGSSCWYQHTLRNVGLQADAHDDFIYCAVVGAAPPTATTPTGAYEIYTGGKDQKVKRWLAIPDSAPSAPSTAPSLLPADAISAGPSPSSSSSLVRFSLHLDATTPFESGVTSLLLAADCLFCGLHNGSIRGFHRASSTAFHLTGHMKEVQALGLVDGILISGDFRGELRFWKPELSMDGTPNFVCAQKLNMPSPIRCIKEVMRTQPGDAHGGKFLWVGCMNHVAIVDLLSLSIAHTHNLGDIELGETGRGPQDICMDMIIFQNTVLCGCSSGNIVCCSVDGPELQRFNRVNKGIMSMTGVVANSGPQLVLGSRRGFFDFIALPSMKHVSSFQPHDENIRALVAVDPQQLHPGSSSPPWFVSVSEDRCVALWQLV
eukprot:Gregarina_sp_Pseudo_9__732@NODE_1468_length_1574_cov_31_304886_g1363_i0_p1_GENE_NODE_1468_length_1574_cov_31_304886_g1363_i0NODE_1468_length_1574_cov_31_304886_g1363_i0_p1_ORF_typecomplete_len437_score64_75zfCCCH/PF00642_24/1_5e06WD40/PF00400_32/9_1WD40/PF00400_32/1e04WD40/PF00400_32/80WD40/PF00400_32/3e03WD40/PF00400_32/1_5zfCCCH_4/PF18044_1/0_0039WD40_like/PF17005_5/3_6e03WD40_like/PF17005_5/0_11zf_CCCH_4/PF18345_1/0_062Torus/PF16131_5/0_1ANAPC4_WD40/PF12894_7/5_5e02ANAPC4_WD40/PF12894_7/3_8e0